MSISLGAAIPNYYWQAVPAHDFQAPNLATVIIGDGNQVTNIVNQTQSIGNVTIVNNVVVNNVVNINFVEEKTQQKVAAYDVALTSDADRSGKVDGDTIDASTRRRPLACRGTAHPSDIRGRGRQGKSTAGQSGTEATTENSSPTAATDGPRL